MAARTETVTLYESWTQVDLAPDDVTFKEE